jgi:hypothetical protein
MGTRDRCVVTGVVPNADVDRHRADDPAYTNADRDRADNPTYPNADRDRADNPTYPNADRDGDAYGYPHSYSDGHTNGHAHYHTHGNADVCVCLSNLSRTGYAHRNADALWDGSRDLPACGVPGLCAEWAA